MNVNSQLHVSRCNWSCLGGGNLLLGCDWLIGQWCHKVGGVHSEFKRYLNRVDELLFFSLSCWTWNLLMSRLQTSQIRSTFWVLKWPSVRGDQMWGFGGTMKLFEGPFTPPSFGPDQNHRCEPSTGPQLGPWSDKKRWSWSGSHWTMFGLVRF